MSDTRAGRLLSLIFLGFAALCLVVPLLQTVQPIVPAIVPPLEEWREPNPFPPLRLLLGANGHFAQALNDWFDDRVGFRDLFIRTKNQIDYSLFATSRKVFLGKDGWLFTRDDGQAIERLSSARLAELEGRFVQLAQRLREKGIRLIVVGYPDKSQIYPEMAPPQMPAIPDGGNFDKLRYFLASQPSLTFIDAKALLKQARSQTADRLFAKTDPHPTEIGQIPVVSEIIAQIARLEGRAGVPLEDFKVQHYSLENWGTEARFLSLLSSVTERDYPAVISQYGVGTDELDGKWTMLDPLALERADDGVGRPFDFEFRSNPDLCSQRLPGTVLFGNSFTDLYWSLGFQHYFCFIRRTRDPMSRFKLFYQTIPTGTKYMIFQFVSFWLPFDAPPDDYVE
jgi:hypothetical protein